MSLDVEYRNLPHDGGKVSTIGIGTGSLHGVTLRDIKDIISYGVERGRMQEAKNYFDKLR